MDSIWQSMKFCCLMSPSCGPVKTSNHCSFTFWALEKFVKGFSVSDIFPVDVSLHFLLHQTPILQHFLCRQCKQRSLKVQWCIFVIINSSAALWTTQSSVSSVWHKLCLCSSSRFGFLLKLSAWLWRLSTVNYESILQGKLIQYWWLAHFIGSLCPDDLSHWVGDSTIRDCTDVKISHPIPNQSLMGFHQTQKNLQSAIFFFTNFGQSRQIQYKQANMINLSISIPFFINILQETKRYFVSHMSFRAAFLSTNRSWHLLSYLSIFTFFIHIWLRMATEIFMAATSVWTFTIPGRIPGKVDLF